MSKGDIYRVAELNGHGSPYLLRKHWDKVEAFLVKIKNNTIPPLEGDIWEGELLIFIDNQASATPDPLNPINEF
ncbi:MAG TPA: hypothetical protein DGJ56_10040 [Verrucomicrobiales bacterium]|nr:hypothetical protein [Verrucomicrobiales bacterium]